VIALWELAEVARGNAAREQFSRLYVKVWALRLATLEEFARVNYLAESL
jgi:hypothetical protein